LADTHGSYCCYNTGKERPNAHAHAYEDTRIKNITKQKTVGTKERKEKEGRGRKEGKKRDPQKKEEKERERRKKEKRKRGGEMGLGG